MRAEAFVMIFGDAERLLLAMSGPAVCPRSISANEPMRLFWKPRLDHALGIAPKFVGVAVVFGSGPLGD